MKSNAQTKKVRSVTTMKRLKHNYPKQFPEIVSFLVTNKCVCRCRHCFNWHQTSQRGAIGNTKKADLTIEEIERIFKGFDPIEYLYIGGGEPFIRKDLAKIIEIIYRNTQPKTLNISTNGQFPEHAFNTVRSITKEFPELKVIVKVSIDAIGKEHDKIRQKEGAFEKAMKTYQLLHEIKKRDKKLEIGINTVFSKLNQDTIDTIYHYIAHLSPQPDCMTQLLVRADPLDADVKKGLDFNKYEQWTQRYTQDMATGKFEPDVLVKAATMVMYEYLYRIVRENACSIHCYAGISGAFIDNEGMVGSCEHKSPYSSLRDNGYNFKKIWYSPHAEMMRHDSYNYCYCTNEPQWWHPSVAYNKEAADKVFVLVRTLTQFA